MFAASTMPDVARIAGQVQALQLALMRDRINPWLNAVGIWYHVVSLRRDLRQLRLQCEGLEVPDAAATGALTRVAQELSGFLDRILRVRDRAQASDRSAYRFVARHLDSLYDEMEDLQETAALAASARFREFVVSELETE